MHLVLASAISSIPYTPFFRGVKKGVWGLKENQESKWFPGMAWSRNENKYFKEVLGSGKGSD
jgi:hypothetical protein